MDNPNCTKCKHYYITLDERFPRACRVFNIKGKTMPSLDIRRLTGLHCPVFENKEVKKRSFHKRNQVIDTLA